MPRKRTPSQNARIGQERRIDGPNNTSWLARAHACSVRTTVDHDIVIDPERGEGVTLYDADGNAYLDFGFVGADTFGFGSAIHPIRQEIYRVSRVPFLPEQDIYNTYGISAKEALARRTPLAGSANSTGTYASLVNGERSGGAANECVLKMLLHARPERRIFATFNGAFHGRPLGVLSLMDRRKLQRVRDFPTVFAVLRLPYPHTSRTNPKEFSRETFRGLRDRDDILQCTNALFIEVVQGEGGILVADAEALQFIVEKFREHDVAIVVDEVQTGMARTGTLWGYEQFGFLPDIVTMGKSLGGGAQDINAVVAQVRWNFREHGVHSSTFSFEPAKAAATLAALRLIDEKRYCERAQQIGVVLDERLKELEKKSSVIRETRGLGAMYGVEFSSAKARDVIRERLRDLGVLTQPAGFNESNPTIRIMPPLAITDDELRFGIELLTNVILKTFPRSKR